jgi:hypothetical protein
MGDRACKAIHIESWKNQIVLEVDLLSRIRSPSGHWEFYSAEDISDGKIVFTGVEGVEFEPSGPLPNDLINEIQIEPMEASGGRERWLFEASIGSVAPDGRTTEIIVRVTAAGFHLEDPRRPGVEIRE